MLGDELGGFCSIICSAFEERLRGWFGDAVLDVRKLDGSDELPGDVLEAWEEETVRRERFGLSTSLLGRSSSPQRVLPTFVTLPPLQPRLHHHLQLYPEAKLLG